MGIDMSQPKSNINCEEVRELMKEDPEQAAIIIEMLKEAGEDCFEQESENAVQ
jgi:hypothetical protein